MIREATLDDAKRISEVAEPLRMGTEEEIAAAMANPDSVWVIDDEGRWCQVARKPKHGTIAVGPLMPLDMGDDPAKALLRECIAGAYRTFPRERRWEIVTYIPAENRHAAEAFAEWFELDLDRDWHERSGGAVSLSLPSLTDAYERSQRWQVR